MASTLAIFDRMFRRSDAALLPVELELGDRVAFFCHRDNEERIGRVVSFVKLTGPGAPEHMHDGVSVRAEPGYGGGLYTTGRSDVRFIRRMNRGSER